MARLFAETSRGYSALRWGKTLSLFAVLGIASSGCSRPATPAAGEAPHEPSKTSIDPAPAVPASPELVEVWVGARNLPVGTVITGEELPALAVRKKLPKDALPPGYVANLEEFLGRRLTRLSSKDAPFDPTSFSQHRSVQPPDQLYPVVTLSLPVHTSSIGFVTLGARVDVLTTLNHASRPVAIRLLLNVQVLAIDSNSKNPQFCSVSFAMTQEQSLLSALAKQRDCKFDILPRWPGKKEDSDYDIKQLTAMLQDDEKLAMFLKAKASPAPTARTRPEPIAAPRELIEVWVAVGDIPPRSVITRELVDAKLKKINVSKDRAEGAITDLTSLLEQEWTLESGLRQGQLLTVSLVGRPQPADKAESEEVEVAPMPRAVKQKVYKDVTITTPSGRKIYRYEEVAPDQFNLVGVFAADDGRKAGGRAVTPPEKGNR